jgi:hypothetical protein
MTTWWKTSAASDGRRRDSKDGDRDRKEESRRNRERGVWLGRDDHLIHDLLYSYFLPSSESDSVSRVRQWLPQTFTGAAFNGFLSVT